MTVVIHLVINIIFNDLYAVIYISSSNPKQYYNVYTQKAKNVSSSYMKTTLPAEVVL